MTEKIVKISEINPNPDNPRVIKDDKFKKLVKSLQDFPEMAQAREIVVNKDMVVLGGNMRLKAMKEAGWKEAKVKIVDWSEEKQREFVVKDNASFGEWDYDLLVDYLDKDTISQWGVDFPRTAKEEGLYTNKVVSPVYEPVNKKPHINSLYDDSRQKELLSKVALSLTSKEVKDFLSLATYRFVEFNYAKIADYYANSDKETQTIFEDLALVIIDYNKAIENGFVVLNKSLNNIDE